MTVTTDLQTNIGIIRTLFIKIDGIEPIFWMRAEKAAPSWDRTIYECMSTEYEESIGLNPNEPVADSPVISFKLHDFKENDGTSYFGKLFAPRRWETANHCYLASDITVDSVIPSDATTIPCNNTSVMDSSGYAHIGQECISYTGKTSTSLTGCTRGLYPAIYGASSAKSHIRPFSAEIDSIIPVSAVPFNMIGRMITLYAITYDKTTNSWNDEENAYLVWIGRISDKIIYDKGMWEVSCEGLLKDLEKGICESVYTTSLKQVINITGTSNERTLILTNQINVNKITYTPVSESYYRSITIPAGLYSLDGETAYPSLVTTINDLLYGITWTDETGAEVSKEIEVKLIWEDDKIGINVQTGISKWYDAADAGGYSHIMWVRTPSRGKYFSSILAILGFDQKTVMNLGKGDYNSSRESPHLDWFSSTLIASKEPYVAYHPVKNSGGGRIYVTDHSSLISDQGDYALSALGAILIKADLEQRDKKDCEILLRYNYKGKELSDNIETQYLDLVVGQKPTYEIYDYIAWKNSEESPEVEQIYNPAKESFLASEFVESEYQTNSVFKVLLRLVLSTGTRYANSTTYDVLHRRIAGLGFPEVIVDVDSFETADKEIANEVLADRDVWLIKKGDDANEVISNELKLFGYALVWSNQKYKIIKTNPIDINTYQYEITDHSAKKAEYDTSTTINQYEVSIMLDSITLKKEKAKIIISDADSIEGLNQKRVMKIDHSGIISSSAEVLKQSLKKFLGNRWLRYSGMKIKMTLNPEYMTKIDIGDVIIVNNSYVYDIVTGTYGGSWYCWIINMQKYFTKGWSCVADVIVVKSTTETRGNPWAGSVLVDYSAANGGWNSGSYILTLKPLEFGETNDYDDGKVFNNTDKIVIIQRNAANPSNPLIWGPYTLDENYENTAANSIKLPDGTELTDWDANQEYIVVPADYTETPTTQLSEGSWMCDESTIRFSDDSIGYRW